MPRSTHLAVLLAASTLACGGGEQSNPASEHSGAGPSAARNDGGAQPLASPWFREVAAERGLDFRHVRSHELRYWIPETVTGGGGWLDYDGDGHLDVYLVQGGDPQPGLRQSETDRLYRGRGDGTFEDVTEAAGIVGDGYGFGLATGDYDSDGDTDIYVCNLERNFLFRNEGDGTFTEVAEEAGVAETRFSSAAAFSDYDGDGDLDLLVVNYLDWAPEREIPCKTSYGERDYCNPINYDAPTRDTLYRNEGDGHFVDVTVQAGLGEAVGTGLGCVCADLDGDGDSDFYVTNDGMPNRLWLNDGHGRFVDEGLLAGCAVNESGASEAGMGVQAVDVEEDGDWDLFMTHVREQTNTFYINRGGVFADRTSASGLARASVRFTGFGMGFFDGDLDGILDLFVANGRVGKWRPAFSEDDPFAEPNQLFRGLGARRFRELEGWLAGGELLGTSRAAAFGDFDDDGDIDILYVDAHAPVRLLENVAPRAGHWVGFSVQDAHGSAALGADLLVEAGGRRFHRLCHTAYSYAAANDPRVHVGLGAADEVARVRVVWPDGTREEFGPFAAGRYHLLRRGAGRPEGEESR